MPRGLPANYIKKAKRELGKGASWHDVFKRAWELYKGSKVYKAVSGNPGKKKGSRKKSSKRSVFSLARRKKRTYNRKFTIPVAPLVGLATGFATPPRGYPKSAIQYAMDGDINNFINALSNVYLGYNPPDGTFDIKRASRGLLPLVLGLLVHKFVGGSPLNLNRTLARMKIPLIRI